MIVLIYVIAAITILSIGYVAGKKTAKPDQSNLLNIKKINQHNLILTTALVNIRANPNDAALQADLALNDALNYKEI